MNSPIEAYLDDLQRSLPVPNPRVVEEVRGHLEESRERAMSAGATESEAELQAIRDLGSVEALVASVKAEGTPQLSPVLVRVAPWIAALLALPAFVFLAVNLIEVAAGNEGGIGVFGDTFEPWDTEINRLLTLGPIVSFLLVFLTRSNFRVGRVERGVEVSLHLRLKGWSLVVALTALLLVVGVVGYLFSENYFCTLETFPIC